MTAAEFPMRHTTMRTAQHRSATRPTWASLLAAVGCVAAGGCASAGGGGADASAGPAPATRPAPNVPAPSRAANSAGGGGPVVVYRPVTNVGYILHRLDSLTLHVPGGEQQQTLERTAYLRLTVTDGPASGYRATIVLDSMHVVASAVPISPDSLLPLRGLQWTATVTPAGQVTDLAANRSTTLGDQLTNQLRLLFPTLPAGGARDGSQWSDSTRFPLKADAFDATEQAKATYRAVAEGQGGIKIESRSKYQRSGTGMQFNQRLEMTAAGQRDGTYHMGWDGVLRSAEGRDVGTMTITVPAAGQKVPVNQSGRYEIRASGR